MSGRYLPDKDFIRVWKEANCAPETVAQVTGLTLRAVYTRRKKLASLGEVLPTIPITNVGKANNVYTTDAARAYVRERQVKVEDGAVVVFSDAHFWPQERTTANQALLEIIKDLKPKRVVANGDIFDGARISRHAPLGWAEIPTVKEEIEICQERMHEIRMAAQPKKTQCEFDWNIGNHDQRFDKFLVANASEMEGAIPRLQDKFPEWEMAWSLRINKDVMVKHRWHNGIHATYNNALKSGVSIVTGHLHRLIVTPWGDYTGRRYGVDTGTLSCPNLPQYDYLENNPTPWCSGFAILTFRGGQLLPPELCEVINGIAYFRGEIVYDNR